MQISADISDATGHGPLAHLQKERLQIAQHALLLLLLLLHLVVTFLVNALIFSLFVVLLLHPWHPRSPVLARVGSGVVGWKVNRYGCLVVVGEPGQQLLDYIWPLVCQVVPLVRVACDVEQPDVFVDGGFLVKYRAFEVPPATG